MFRCTHTYTRTYKLRCLSTRCIKKWNLFFWQTISIWNMTALSPLPLCRSSCAIRACRMPHLQFIYKIYHTAHTANAAYVRSMYTPRRPSVCVCVCIWQGRRLHDRQLRVHYFICTLCLSAFQTFIFRCTWPPLPPLLAAIVGIVVYKLQLTTAQRGTFARLFAEPQANQLRASLATRNGQLATGSCHLVARSQQLAALVTAYHLCRYGASPLPPDGGSSVTIALLDKLIENGRNYSYELVLCLKILLRNIPMIEMPFKVSWIVNERTRCSA